MCFSCSCVPQYLVFVKRLTISPLKMYDSVYIALYFYQIPLFRSFTSSFIRPTYCHILYCIIQHVVIQYFLAGHPGLGQLPDYVD